MGAGWLDINSATSAQLFDLRSCAPKPDGIVFFRINTPLEKRDGHLVDILVGAIAYARDFRGRDGFIGGALWCLADTDRIEFVADGISSAKEWLDFLQANALKESRYIEGFERVLRLPVDEPPEWLANPPPFASVSVKPKMICLEERDAASAIARVFWLGPKIQRFQDQSIVIAESTAPDASERAAIFNENSAWWEIISSFRDKERQQRQIIMNLRQEISESRKQLSEVIETLRSTQDDNVQLESHVTQRDDLIAKLEAETGRLRREVELWTKPRTRPVELHPDARPENARTTMTKFGVYSAQRPSPRMPSSERRHDVVLQDRLFKDPMSAGSRRPSPSFSEGEKERIVGNGVSRSGEKGKRGRRKVLAVLGAVGLGIMISGVIFLVLPKPTEPPPDRVSRSEGEGGHFRSDIAADGVSEGTPIGIDESRCRRSLLEEPYVRVQVDFGNDDRFLSCLRSLVSEFGENCASEAPGIGTPLEALFYYAQSCLRADDTENTLKFEGD